jgi:beta-lactamase regulating signal transducer with metallopeptidase domain
MNITEAVLWLSRSLEVSLLLKATILLAAGLVAARIAARARASLRHLILGATFGAVLALPLLVATGPQVSVKVPAADGAQALEQISSREGQPERPPQAMGVPHMAQGVKVPQWETLALVVWIGGAAVNVLFLGWQLLWQRRVRRAGIPWLEKQQRIRSLALECGVRKPVDVLLSESIDAPITCGTRRPAVFLPFDAPSWTGSDLDRALIHELEHVRRSDWVVQLVARGAVSLYWFHPLVWMAWRRLCLEAERACDDGVIGRTESTEYAEQLVSLAQRMSRAQAPALGMANRSDLAERVSAVLDSRRQRGPTHPLAAALAMVAAALALFAIAPLTAVAQAPAQRTTESRRVRAMDRALYEAAEAGDLDDVNELLNAGANVNAAIRGDGSPLIGAARKGRLDIVIRLLDRGADPNLPVTGDGNPMIVAAAGGHMEIVSLLLNRGARIDEVVPGDENALIQASGNGRLNAVKLLVSRGANVNLRLWVETSGAQSSGEWRSPLIMARKGGHQAVVDFLLASGARE